LVKAAASEFCAIIMTDMNLSDLLRLDGRDFVNRAYLAILKRPADESGMRTNLLHLSQGLSKENIILALAKSPEAAALSEPTLDVTPLLEADQRDRGTGLIALLRRKSRNWANKSRHGNRSLERIEHAVAELQQLLVEQQRLLAEQNVRLDDLSAGAPSLRRDPVDALFADARQALEAVPDAHRLIENLSHVVRASALARSFQNGR
jgi:hypothetical protein